MMSLESARFAFLLASVVLPASSLSGQAPSPATENQGALTIGAAQRRTLPKGITHQWNMQVAEARFAHVELRGDGADLLIRIRDPQGVTAREVRPRWVAGTGRVSWIARVPGTWVAEVVSSDGGSGPYEIALVAVRSPTPRDSGAVEADSLLMEAMRASPTRAGAEGAVRSLQRAIQVYAGAGDRLFEAAGLHALGTFHGNLGRNDSAAVQFHRALAAWREARDRGGEAGTLHNIAFGHATLGRPDSALAYYRLALAIRREIGDRRGEGATLNGIGMIHSRVGRTDSAHVLFQQALAISREVGDRRGEASNLVALGVLHGGLGRRDSSLAYDRQALPMMRELGDRRGEASVLNNLGVSHGTLGSPDSAMVYYALALAIRQEVGDRTGEGSTLNNMGRIHLGLGQPDSAGARFHVALAILREVGDLTRVSETLSNLGLLHVNIGQPDSALVYLREALTIARQVGDRRGEAQRLNMLGIVSTNYGRLDSALALFGQVLVVATETGDRGRVAGALNNLGLVHWRLGQPRQALARYAEAIVINRELGDRPSEAAVLDNMGMIHADLGQPDSAMERFKSALTIRRAVRDRPGEGTTLNNLGRVSFELGRPDSALVYLRQALDIRHEVGDRPGESVTLQFTGRVHAGMSQPDSALAYYVRALSIQRALGLRWNEGVTLETLAQTLHRRGRGPDLRSAVAYYDSSASVTASMRREAGDDPNRVSFAEWNAGVFGPWSLAWLARENEVGQRNAAHAALAAGERGRAQALLDLHRDAGAVPPPGSDLAAEGAALTRAVTRTGAIAISYVLTSDTLLALLATRSGDVLVHRHPITRDSLATLVAAFRGALGVDAATQLEQLARGATSIEAAAGSASATAGRVAAGSLGQDLVGILLPPAFREHMRAASEILIVPQGPLAMLPFGVLPLNSWDPDGGGDLGVRIPLRYAPSLAFVQLAEGRPSREIRGRRQVAREALVVGDPTMPEVTGVSGTRDTLRALPRAREEAQWLAARLGAQPLIGAAAGEGVVRARLNRAPLVHLATHGYAYANEARARSSFVALAPAIGHDGLLTVEDLLDDPEISLSAELVVLSACQTGLGDLKQAEGTIGLQRAFLAKGARGVLVSLWSVSDLVTTELMKRFYTHWLDDRDAPAKSEALRRAQQDIRQTPGWEHPRFWAAFHLVGAR